MKEIDTRVREILKEVETELSTNNYLEYKEGVYETVRNFVSDLSYLQFALLSFKPKVSNPYVNEIYRAYGFEEDNTKKLISTLKEKYPEAIAENDWAITFYWEDDEVKLEMTVYKD